MEQHENISCADFQAWKEANDPNRQLEGLAIHLKENGIGKYERQPMDHLLTNGPRTALCFDSVEI